MTNRGRGVGRAIASGIVLGLVLATVHVAIGLLAGRDPIDERFAAKYVRHWGLVATHGLSAVVALLAGSFQLAMMQLRILPRAHRTTGRIYAVAVVVAGVTAIPMGLMAHGGPAAQIGMVLNGALWLGTLLPAVMHAMQHDFARHREWVMRNFALTFSAVVLRLAVQLGERVGFDYEAVYPVAAWVNWLLPLLLVEAYLRAPAASRRSSGGHLPAATR